jgi:hypothetical protein
LDLYTLSLVGQFLAGVSVLAAVVFGFTQIRQYRQQRRDMIAVELVRSIQNSEWAHAFRLVYSLPDEIRAAELRAKGSEVEDAAYHIGVSFESIGLLVFRGHIPIDVFEELVGGVTITLWRKLRGWAGDVRAEEDEKQLLEWFQWLAEQMEVRGRKERRPVYEQHRDWMPKG